MIVSSQMQSKIIIKIEVAMVIEIFDFDSITISKMLDPRYLVQRLSKNK